MKCLCADAVTADLYSWAVCTRQHVQHRLLNSLRRKHLAADAAWLGRYSDFNTGTMGRPLSSSRPSGPSVEEMVYDSECCTCFPMHLQSPRILHRQGATFGGRTRCQTAASRRPSLGNSSTKLTRKGFGCIISPCQFVVIYSLA